jgi:hypothetical protein
MALFNTPAFNQSAAALNRVQVPAPLTDNRPNIAEYMTRLRADDRVIGGPVERKGFGGALDRMRSAIDKRVAAEGLQKKYAELIETQKRDRANRWLDKWFTMNPEGSPNDAAEYYQEMLEDDSNLQLSRKRSLQQLDGMIGKMPYGTLQDAYREQLRILTEMARGRNAGRIDGEMRKPTAPMSRRPWQEPSSDFFSV